MSEINNISNVLVVAEEEAGRNTIARRLKSMGYGCECVGLEEAWSLDLTDRDIIDLVILDIESSNAHGLGLLKKMSGVKSGQSVIVMSKHMQGYTYGEIIEAGAADVIAKPFEMSELKVKIERINRERHLLAKSMELETALQVMLARREQRTQESVVTNLEALILPCVKRLEATRLNEIQRMHVAVLKSGLMEIRSPFRVKFSQKHPNLSPMEVQVAKLIKVGMGNKEMADILGVSVNTIMTHRHHLRTKLGVKGKNVNLHFYINSIDV